MLLFLYLSFAVLQLSARLVVRDIEPAEDTLMNITNQLDNISNAIATFNESSAQIFQIIDLYNDVMQTTVNATTQVQSCIDTNGAATESDADEFINLADQSYIPVIGQVLNAMLNEKLKFENTSLGTAVIKPLQSTLIDYNITNGKYLAALVSGAPQAFLADAIAIQDQITAEFTAAIEAFNSP